MMVLPAVGGRWLDERQGTTYWAPIGLVVGLICGMWQLLQIAGVGKRRRTDASQKPSSSHKPNSASPTDSTDA
jgi:hypothetical protein